MKRALLGLAVSLALVGCGGGGGPGESAPVQQVVAAPVAKSAVAIGDSITNYWDLASAFPGLDITNAGVPGQDAPAMLARFQHDVLDRHPTAVVILAGTNHTFGGGDVPSVIAMASEARSAGIHVVLCIPPPRAFSMDDFIVPLRAQAAAAGFPLVDYYDAMVLPDGNEDPSLFRDGTHPNDAGYAVMRLVLMPALEEALQ